jgi:hypothetical protein
VLVLQVEFEKKYNGVNRKQMQQEKFSDTGRGNLAESSAFKAPQNITLPEMAQNFSDPLVLVRSCFGKMHPTPPPQMPKSQNTTFNHNHTPHTTHPSWDTDNWKFSQN